ncbi:MAG: hypothetical protein EOP45_19575 [Sphingobacteriaceae bacterium]|nr:MAG: hypothetical protein EOP45_19575 [Sphingobacteriaceae bacterium]
MAKNQEFLIIPDWMGGLGISIILDLDQARELLLRRVRLFSVLRSSRSISFDIIYCHIHMMPLRWLR